jgi:hypothetical protein
MPTIQIHNADTGEIIEREMTPQEIVDQQKRYAEKLKRIEDEKEAIVKREAALAKLAALGLAKDDLQALGL